MPIREYVIVCCDGRNCEREIRHLGRRLAKTLAQESGWTFYFSSTFCPSCWVKIEKFLKGDNHAAG